MSVEFCYANFDKDLTLRPDLLLSSGRTITHRRLPNGAQEAMPTTGYYAMTNEEYDEYCNHFRPINKGE